MADKVRDALIQALAGYMRKTTKKKPVKKKKAPYESKQEETKAPGPGSVQPVHVESSNNEADVALRRMQKQPDWGLLKGEE